MRRKRLSDLLQEEAQKDSVSEPLLNQSDNDSEASTPSLSDSEVSTPKTSSRRTKEDINNQLQTQVKELTSALDAANQRGDTLQNQVDSLTSELTAQQILIENLQTQLQEINQLKEILVAKENLVQTISTELAEQKGLVEKLYAELQKLEQERLSDNQQESEDSSDLALQTPSNYGIQPRSVGLYIAQSSSTILSNEEIGWFD